MKTIKLCLLLSLATCGIANAQFTDEKLSGGEHGVGDGATRLTNEATAETGTILKRDLKWKSNIPLNKTYGELTPEQRASLHALYEKLPDGDEPPYPITGLKPVFNQIRKGQHILQSRGELNLAVTVGADGKAIKVEDFGGVMGANAYEMTNYAQSVLLFAKYKPAMCSGKPCVMQFPLRIPLN